MYFRELLSRLLTFMKKVISMKPPEGDCSRFNAIELRQKKPVKYLQNNKNAKSSGYIIIIDLNDLLLNSLTKYFRNHQVFIHVFAQ